MIVLDTSALSHAFRRRSSGAPPHPCVRVLEQLIADDAELAVPGVVFQELLSGVRGPRQADRLEEALAGFPLLLATGSTHRRAADLVTRCRRRGIATATVEPPDTPVNSPSSAASRRAHCMPSGAGTGIRSS